MDQSFPKSSYNHQDACFLFSITADQKTTILPSILNDKRNRQLK
ncbi:hypothetical protein D931_03001 [Enterococcus faecium 13.SD.W.09]|nr:hypothetical protein D931_03001 [Enterococcus faecium 13.SD.W.09]